ncbi:hypothetical protein KP509_18G062000 [Ceratopteris richardii]|uniref:Uncharacterized protein n=1 Tax=Ceratopteris richardii TaxID=49495 RepID=A0A8T2SQ17_CERRI|nr:hypothetical protein KP509_18G062000 [Ceratopteris richardii]
MKDSAHISTLQTPFAPLCPQDAENPQCDKIKCTGSTEFRRTASICMEQTDTVNNFDSFDEAASRGLPTVKAYSAQCYSCLKWRLIPTKQLYEEIRQTTTANPFVCSRASSWHPQASCSEPSDLTQGGGLLWAIDKPDIPLAPAGWERLLCFRAEGSGKFADVYYKAPTGIRLRSMREVERFLAEHPEYVSAGVKRNQFSFLRPKPLNPRHAKRRTSENSRGMRGSISLTQGTR